MSSVRNRHRGVSGVMAVVLIVLEIGCGDNSEELPDDSEELPPLPTTPFGYASPDAFPRDRCIAGSLAGLSPAGLYHGSALSEGQRFDTSSRVDVQGKMLSGEISGRALLRVTKSDDDLFLYRGDATSLTAIDWCGRRSDGELLGTYVRCTSRGCLVGEMIGRQVFRLDEADASNLTLLGETMAAGSRTSTMRKPSP
jgi:hypothetical protein